MSQAENQAGRIRRIVILGGGTAGLLTAIAFKKKLDPAIELVVVRSLKMGVIGVGEGTIPSVVQFLHRFLEIDPQQFHAFAKPSLKLGIRFLWGPRPFFHYTFSGQLMRPHEWFSVAKGYFCDDNFEFADINAALMQYDNVAIRRGDGSPLYDTSFAYHLENKTFVAYLETLTDDLNIEKIDDLVASVTQNETGIESLILACGQQVSGDLFIDCSGFQSFLLHQSLGEPFESYEKALFCDRAIVGGWKRTDEPYHPYTTAETMNAGWCWQIEHDELINRGYVFSSKFLSDDEAAHEYLTKNPKASTPRAIDFRPGVYRRSWVKNVVAIGNSVGFVEPLEATAIGMICDSILHLIKGLTASSYAIPQIQRDIFNRIQLKNWEIIRDFLALHYKFNSRLDTPFWRAVQNDVDLGALPELVEYYKEVGPDLSLLTVELKRDFFTAEGYLAMLVGQQVPYRNRLPKDDPQRAKWKMFTARLEAFAKNGVPMGEYLALARNGKLFANQTDRRNNALAPNTSVGELNWH